MYTSNVHWSVYPYFDEICDYLFSHQVMYLFVYQDIVENLSLENVSQVFCFFVFQSLAGHTTPVDSVRFGHNEEMVVAGSMSGALKIWNLEEAKSNQLVYLIVIKAMVQMYSMDL